MAYQAKLLVPFGVLGIQCDDTALTAIDFLPRGEQALAPHAMLAREACAQLEAYLADPGFRFDLPLRTGGTTHQQKVWRAMRAIPRGRVKSYGEVAAALGSSARAVGQACGANPLPVVIPCHRIVGASGLGGFAHRRGGWLLEVKGWLLAHEGAL